MERACEAISKPTDERGIAVSRTCRGGDDGGVAGVSVTAAVGESESRSLCPSWCSHLTDFGWRKDTTGLLEPALEGLRTPVPSAKPETGARCPGVIPSRALN